MIASRTLSTPVFEAASISSTSIERPSAISRQEGQASASVVRQGVGVGFVGLVTVDGLGKQARGRRLPDAARARKEVGVMQALVLDGVAERPRDVLLPRDLLEGLRAPLACDDLVGHCFESEERLMTSSPFRVLGKPDLLVLFDDFCNLRCDLVSGRLCRVQELMSSQQTGQS